MSNPQFPADLVTFPEEILNGKLHFLSYDHKDILNAVERGCFFKALSTKNLAQKGKKSKGGKESKQRIKVAFFVSADGGKVGKRILIWRSKTSRCFRLGNAADKLSKVMYFADSKS